jgi:ADP-ribosylglycohydrolase
VPEISLENRIRGCLLGGAVGDALGAPVEFWSIDEIAERAGAVRSFLPVHHRDSAAVGLITDDTQMTMFTVEGLIRMAVRSAERGVDADPAVLHHAYWRWYDTQMRTSPGEPGNGWLAQEPWLYARRAPGTTCMRALAATRSGNPFEGGELNLLGRRADNDSKGCGGVMRAAPIGFVAESEDDAFRLGCESAAYTHGHPAGQHSAGALAVIIHSIASGRGLHRAVADARGVLARTPRSEETARALDLAIELGTEPAIPPAPQSIVRLGEGWVGEEALAISVFAALKHPGQDEVLDALSLAVTHSGDSDSTGAICGNILGALHGLEAVPSELVAALEGREVLLQLADDLALVVTAGPAGLEVRYPGY